MSDKKMDFSCQGIQEGGVALFDKDGSAVGVMFKEEDARRVVACLNACEGISTECIEDHTLQIKELWPQYDNAVRQRDEMLAFCELVASEFDYLLDNFKGGSA